MRLGWLKTVALVVAAITLSTAAGQGRAQETQGEQPEDCPFEQGWKPENLPRILEEHWKWVASWKENNHSEEWAKTHPEGKANLCNADLRGANLSKADLTGANLGKTNLFWANLAEAHLRWANLTEANLLEANLSKANLSEANLGEAYLGGADLTNADLRWANLTEADLTVANLSKADLSGANLTQLPHRF